MKYIPYFLFFSLVVMALVASKIALADSSSVLLEVQTSTPIAVEQPTTWWGKLRFWLGARSLQLKPNPGTALTVNSSAYAPSPYQTDSTPCITAAGTRVRDGVVATNFLPLGTVLEINGKRYIVEDRMNSRYSITSAQQAKYLDIWFPSTEEALQFGRQKLKITIVEYGSPGQNLQPISSATPKTEAVVTPEPPILDRASERVNTVFTALTQFLTAAVGRSHGDVDCSNLE